MAKVGEDPSSLFRSLRPDDAKFQAGTASAAREAELRWPLFKTISPKKPEPTPALSADERRRWSNQERPSIEERKPALSVPGVSSKLAKSLSRMAPRPAPAPAVAAVAEAPVAAPLRRKPVSESVRITPNPTQKPPERERAGPFSRMVAANPVEEVQEEDYEAQAVETQGRQGVAAKAEMPALAPAGNSLVSLFKRLEKDEKIEKVIAKPARRQSSFMGRIGKR